MRCELQESRQQEGRRRGAGQVWSEKFEEGGPDGNMSERLPQSLPNPSIGWDNNTAWYAARPRHGCDGCGNGGQQFFRGGSYCLSYKVTCDNRSGLELPHALLTTRYHAQCPASARRSDAVIYELPSDSRYTMPDWWSSTVDIRPNMLPSGHSVLSSGSASNVGIVIGVSIYLLPHFSNDINRAKCHDDSPRTVGVDPDGRMLAIVAPFCS